MGGGGGRSRGRNSSHHEDDANDDVAPEGRAPGSQDSLEIGVFFPWNKCVGRKHAPRLTMRPLLGSFFFSQKERMSFSLRSGRKNSHDDSFYPISRKLVDLFYISSFAKVEELRNTEIKTRKKAINHAHGHRPGPGPRTSSWYSWRNKAGYTAKSTEQHKSLLTDSTANALTTDQPTN